MNSSAQRSPPRDPSASAAQPRTLQPYQLYDLATLAGPAITAGQMHLYIARSDAEGEPSARHYLCTLPTGAQLFPMQAAGYYFLAVPTAAMDAPAPGDLQADALTRWQTALALAPFLAGETSGRADIRMLEAGASVKLDAATQATATTPLLLRSEEPALAFTCRTPASSQAIATSVALTLAPLGGGWTVQTTAAADVAVLTQAAVAREGVPEAIAEIATAWAQLAVAWLEAAQENAAELVVVSQAATSRSYQQALVDIARAAAGYPPAEQEAASAPLLAALNMLSAVVGFLAPRQADKATHDASANESPVGQLIALARRTSLRYRLVTLSDDWWREAGLPLLGFDREKSPLLLLPRPRGYVTLDPIKQEERRLDAASAKEIMPQAFQFYATLPETITQRSLVEFVLSSIWSNVGWMLVASLLVTLLGLATPVVLSVLVSRVIPQGRLDLLLELTLVLVALAVSATLFRVIEGLASTRFTALVDLRLQSALWDRVMRLPSAFFRRYEVGDLAARVLGIKTISTTLSSTAVGAILAGVMSLTSFAVMAWYSPLLTLFALVYGLSMALLLGVVLRLQVCWLRREYYQQGNVKSLTLQMIASIPKLRVAAAEERIFARWGEAYAAQRASHTRAEIVRRFSTTAAAALPIVGTLGLFLLAGAVSQRLGTAAFVAFYTAFGQFTAAVLQLSQTLTTTLSVEPLYTRARPIFESPLENDASRAEPGPLSGAIAVRNVTFRYRNDGPEVLRAVTFDIAPGQMVAMTGPSGAGKSTILRLLLGFEQPTAGAIYYDEHDLAQLDLRQVRRQIGTVLQDVGVTPGSIYENIAGASPFTRDEVMAAAKLSGFDRDIEAMPMGLETIVSEGGGNLSGGQRQRLIIARVLIHRPRIIFFDEATSALDNETQAAVTASLAQFKTTRFVIAHRLSTIKEADKILVIDKGRIVQRGTYESLVKEDGLFRALVRRQML